MRMNKLVNWLITKRKQWFIRNKYVNTLCLKKSILKSIRFQELLTFALLNFRFLLVHDIDLRRWHRLYTLCFVLVVRYLYVIGGG